MEARTSDGLKLTCELRGEGPRIAMVMGLGMPGSVWGPVRSHLLPHHAVLTWDNRGMGASDLPTRGYRMSRLGDDVAHVLDAAGWDDAHIVGVSMGGMAAQEFVLRHRDRARSLTLIATHSGGPTAVIPKPKGIVRVVQSRVGRKDKRGDALIKLLYPKGARIPVSESMAVSNMVRGASDPKHRKALRYQLGAVFRHDTRARLSRLAGLPTLVIRPDHDILCRPNNNDRLARDIPGAVLRRFASSGHGIVGQTADGLAAAIAAHVRSVEG